MAEPLATSAAASTGSALAPGLKTAGTGIKTVGTGILKTGTGITGTALSAAKVAVVSPLIGVVALAGIVAFEFWKGNRDSQEFGKTDS